MHENGITGAGSFSALGAGRLRRGRDLMLSKHIAMVQDYSKPKRKAGLFRSRTSDLRMVLGIMPLACSMRGAYA